MSEKYTVEAILKASGVEDFKEAFKEAGKSVEGFKNVGKNIGDVGSALTNKITKPALVAAGAITGIVAAFGWKRLVAMDVAKSQLEGLGYAVADVTRISEQVRAAVQGTIMTMAEGTSVAAGALAAGVKEGAELEKYIKLVGSAAVGAGGDIDRMATIFNRVQGTGRLMTMELNQIEDAMPGFSQNLSKHFGVSMAEMRKMVTEGKVSADDFLIVMEGFAGGMADAYAGSWEGMITNTKSNIGILGESLLSGVFIQSKESITEFLGLLRSPEAREWAVETGEKIGEAFTTIVEKVKQVVSWWNELDDGTKKLIGQFALFMIALGPILSIIGKFITLGGILAQGISVITTVVGVLGKALMLLAANPIGLVIMAVAAVIAIGVLLYKNWDTIKEKLAILGEKITEIWNNIKEGISSAWESIKTSVSDGIKGAYDTVTGFFGKFKEAGANILHNIADGIRSAIGKVKDAIGGAVQAVRDFLPFSPAKEGPLKDLNKLNFGGTIAESIYNGQREIEQAMARTIPNVKVNAGYSGSVASSGIVQNITINSTEPLSASEVARKTLQTSRNLALEW